MTHIFCFCMWLLLSELAYILIVLKVYSRNHFNEMHLGFNSNANKKRVSHEGTDTGYS